ncbi:MAG: FtsX-like permease family protein [Phycisphaerae bacterium]|nr:FtsX-like permease family protein [Phycisphaerae bacterium]
MTTLHLIGKEILHRKLNFLLGVLGVVGAITLFVFFFTANEASRRETTRLMRDMGLNLRIIPKGTDRNRFWSAGFSDKTMPEEFVDRLASAKGLNYAHMLAMLHKMITWRDREVILTGLMPERSSPDKPKPAMTFKIDPGTVYVGSQLAKAFDLKKGQTIEIRGKPFKIVRCLAESGSDDDIRIFGHIGDVQAALDLPGQINEIKALNCVCLATEQDPMTALCEQLERVLPEAEVIPIKAIFDAREKQRRMVERHLAFILPFVLVLSVVWIGLLAMINVRERRNEIGILRAIGHGSGKIAGLFMGKAVVVGVIGGAIGFVVGTGLALIYGPDIFRVTAKAIQPMYPLLAWSVLGASAFAALASFIPTTMAVTQDPAVTLSQE